MKLSKNFTLEEMVATNHPRLQDTPTLEVVQNLQRLCARNINRRLRRLHRFLNTAALLPTSAREPTRQQSCSLNALRAFKGVKRLWRV